MDARLQEAIARIKAGDGRRAAKLLAALLREDPKNEAAWMWLSATVSDAERQRFCLEKALEINPGNRFARDKLARLAPPLAPQAGAHNPGERLSAASDVPTRETRRKYVLTMGWIRTDGKADRVVLLEPETLTAANPETAALPLIRQQLVVGPVAHELLGGFPRIYPLKKIERVTAAVKGEKMRLIYEKEGQRRRAFIHFANQDDCHDAFNALSHRLGAGYARMDRRAGVLLMALMLLGSFLLAAGMAYGLFRIAAALLSPADPTAALLVSGLLALAVLAWLFRNTPLPPEWMVIERRAQAEKTRSQSG